ncbi:putative cytidine deaminase Cdd [Gordonia spumicola]|uniref:Putative cytidine deaminase Cdd n=1 Tax=Gordonia spumicola TaxID=589161 RepID=A0A7I9V9A8_9ACTN|nr:putative cytidine deaminase Cdd [Gordonia spumicola]
MTRIDFDTLRSAAAAAMTRAYAPYSGFPVGAAAITVDGQIITSANVENVSYGLGVCAEVALVSVGVSTGVLGAAGTGLAAVAVVDANGSPLTPCGRCRQVLLEFGPSSMLVDSEAGPRTLGDLLPDAFGPSHLDAVRDR